eukprot:GHVR01098110.1.p1 GENE.GHVR01098110.1~~GHVR01098110.1.p1  ORF type:complete len:277 (+),score=29.17 GHVR01098110.1:680-1510(+)
MEQLIDIFSRLAYITSNLKNKAQYQGVTPLFETASKIDPGICERFFGQIVPFLKDVILQMPELFIDQIRLLKKGMRGSVTVTNKQALSLIAAGFFQIMPETGNDKLGTLNLRKFYRTPASQVGQATKLVCLLHYFEQSKGEPSPVAETITEEPPADIPAEPEVKGKKKPDDKSKKDAPPPVEVNVEKEKEKTEEPTTVIVFSRRVLPDTVKLTVNYWLNSTSRLQPVVLAPEADNPDNDPSQYSVMPTINTTKPGGDVLSLGCDHEEMMSVLPIFI